MGIPSEYILSDERHTGEFICKICLGLMEYPVYLQGCSHAFCRNCLQQWSKAKSEEGIPPNCPTCKKNLSTDRIVDLQVAEPMAWRVMGRIKVKCPLAASNCTWTGDYYDLASHMTSSKLHLGSSSSSSSNSSSNSSSSSSDNTGGSGQSSSEPRSPHSSGNHNSSLAEQFKEAGNSKFEQAAYREAIALYSKAIAAAPTTATYHYNRAVAWSMLYINNECVKDCDTALKLDPVHKKAYKRRALALCGMGLFHEAVTSLESACDTLLFHGVEDVEVLVKQREETLYLALLVEKSEKALQDGEPLLALQNLTLAQQQCKASRLTCLIAEAEVQLGRVDRAIAITIPILRADPTNIPAYSVRGKALYFRGDFEQALSHLKEALRLDPEAVSAKKVFLSLKKVKRAFDESKSNFNKRLFQDAEKNLTVAIDNLSNLLGPATKTAPPLLIDLLAQRATCFLRMEQFVKALSDADLALYSAEDCKRALMARSTALIKLDRPEDAVKGLETAMGTFGQSDTELRGAYDRAVFAARKKKRIDYYAVLGVSRIASTAEINKAFKLRALECHPDKFADKPEEEQKEAAERFKVLQDGHEILASEPMKRQLYDEGYDKEAIDERYKRAQQAAREGQRGHHH